MCPGLGLGSLLYKRTSPLADLEVHESRDSSGLVVLVTLRGTIHSDLEIRFVISRKRLEEWLNTLQST
jgi:hypothetical protein